MTASGSTSIAEQCDLLLHIESSGLSLPAPQQNVGLNTDSAQFLNTYAASGLVFNSCAAAIHGTGVTCTNKVLSRPKVHMA